MELPVRQLTSIFLLLQVSLSLSSTLSNDSTQSFLCHPSQSFALLQFKNDLVIDETASNLCVASGVDSSPKTASWKEATDCCLWGGVECDEISGNVVGLDLSCCQLYGAIPTNTSLFQLSHLRTLNLAYNYFSGSSVSSEFGRLVNLTRLNISSSGFSGTIPSQISHLSKLVSLDISNNFILILDSPAFEMMSGNMTRLKHLFLDYVNLSAVDPKLFSNLSASLESLSLSESVNLKSLESLVLENCGLEGSIPNFISNLTRITDLNLINNNISGEIPTFFSNLKQLTSLSLSRNKLKGQVPDLFGNLTVLTDLDLGSNNLEGHLPSSMFSLPQLSKLDLSDNKLVSLPFDVSVSLSKLTYLSLDENKLNGTLPSWLFNMPLLENLGISNNLLAGEIPDFESKSLIILRLEQNMLYGRIPETISRLVNLSTLDISSNKINGTIPPSLFSLPISQVNLGNNKLTGEIPEFQSTSLQIINFGGNMLHGRVPESMFQLTNLTDLDLSSNSLFFGIEELNGIQKLEDLRVLDLSYTNVSIPSNTSVNLNWTRLEALYMSSCHISGFPDFLRTQNELQVLDLSNNNIRGEIPLWIQSIGKQTLNVLDLSHNHLTGNIQLPWENLMIVDLSSNRFRGSLPVVPSLMSFFSVSNNSLSGNLPSSICDSDSLEVLDLSRNNFSGNIPPCLGNSSLMLSVLNLQNNNLEGNIDLAFSEDCNVRNLNFQGNKLKGSIPKSLVKCKELEVLDLGDNMLNDSFPSWLETLQELQVLILRSNKLYGSIPELSTNDSFPKMLVLDLSNNGFTGRFPASFMRNFKSMINVVGETDGIYLGTSNFTLIRRRYDYSMTITMKGLDIEIQKIFHVFVSMDFSNNKFHGEIPDDLGQFGSLRGLNLSHNTFSGSIPASIGSLTNLEWLDLSSNKLDGVIPRQLVHITRLAILNLSYNQLVGQIPQGGQFNTFTIDSYRGNLGLCGNPLPRNCEDDELEPPVTLMEVDNNDNSSFISRGFSWQAVVIGYGCGMLFGVGGGYVMFRYRRPQWMLQIIEGKLRLRP